MEVKDLARLKAGGFMKQKQPDLFSLRVRVPVGNITAPQLAKIAEIAETYGKGYVHLTTRQGIEIPFLHFDNFAAVTDELASVDLQPGSCGARVRNVMACAGDRYCSHALVDSQGFGQKIDERFFGRDLPTKIKIAVAGCPNSCAKPQENDIGFMGVVEPEFEGTECINCEICADSCPTGAITLVEEKPTIDRSKCIYEGNCVTSCPTGSWTAKRKGYTVFVGGKLGKFPQLGEVFAQFISEEEGLDLTEKIMMVMGTLNCEGERLGSLINRMGLDKFKEEVLNCGNL